MSPQTSTPPSPTPAPPTPLAWASAPPSSNRPSSGGRSRSNRRMRSNRSSASDRSNPAPHGPVRRTVAREPDNIWGYLEINSATTLGPNRWHRADPDSVFQPENILISSRKANIIALIDRSTGAIVWRLGPYFDEPAGAQHQRINAHTLPRPLDQISGQHNPHFIPDGLPGAGNLLVFDTQGGAGYPPAPLGI